MLNRGPQDDEIGPQTRRTIAQIEAENSHRTPRTVREPKDFRDAWIGLRNKWANREDR